MPVFQYTAVTAEGQMERGLLQGASLEQVKARLLERGLTIRELGIAPGSGGEAAESAPSENHRPDMRPEAASVVGPLVNPVSLADLHFFFRQLSTMLSAGINPGQSLETLSRQTSSVRLQQIIQDVKPRVMEGMPISSGFERYPEVFSPLIISLLRAGEQGGFVPEACHHLSEYIKEEIELRNLIRKETAYPKIVLVLSVVIIFAVNAILSMLGTSQEGLKSPLTNPANWLCLGPMIIGIFLFIRIGLRQEDIRKKWLHFLLKLPAFGEMVHGFAMAKFGRAFGALYRGAVPIPEAVVLAAEACGNEYLRDKIIPVKERLQEGVGITEAFADTGAFNAIVLDMTRTGEVTGNLDFMLTKVAEFYEEEGRVRARQWATYFGVLVFLGVAVYVAYIVITFFMQYASQTMSAG